MGKWRVDELLVRRGLCPNLTAARRAILSGRVRSGPDRLFRQSAEELPEDAPLKLQEPTAYVSRAALKLEPALTAWLPRLDGLLALDLGAATGGFTDLMLQRGAARVYAVDVGRGLLHYRLRSDPRVVCLEGLNARFLTPAEVPELVQVLTADLSFISLKTVLPAVVGVLAPAAWIFVLVKPQFEATPAEVARGGVVYDEAVRQRVVDEVCLMAENQLHWRRLGVIPAPIRGPKGNQEYVAGFRGRECAGNGHRG